jgi:alkaline phosphatase D
MNGPYRIRRWRRREAGPGRLPFRAFLLLALAAGPPSDLPAQSVHLTNGVKAMDVTVHEVTAWTRLCAAATPNPVVHVRQQKVFRHPIGFDESMPVDRMDGGVQGAAGQVRFTLTGDGRTRSSGWMEVAGERDFTAHHHFRGLRPGTRYRLLAEGRAHRGAPVARQETRFGTAPDSVAAADVHLTTSTCQYFWSFDDSLQGFRTYRSMAALQPDLFVQTGDYVYYDKPGPMATTAAKARHKWHAMDGWPSIRAFYGQAPVYMLKDDHDLIADDAHPGSKPFGDITMDLGLRIWQENVPLRDKPYRTLRLGSDLQLWFLEGREFRSRNDMPDGAGKSIWGAEQKAWLERTLTASTAAFKVVFSPTPIVGPDRASKKDNHANEAFRHEGDWARRMLAAQGALVVNGDRHWQYVSRDSATGLWEFGSGPVSDHHAQGWPPDERRPEHRFLRVAGGFLAIRLTHPEGRPLLTLTHYDVDGRQTHAEQLRPEDLARR